MEFPSDKSLYEIEGGSDLELWDSDLHPAYSDIFKNDGDLSDWNSPFMSARHVVVNDRLMTDAVLGQAPIKTEHSYSLACEGYRPDSPSCIKKVDDVDEDYFPAISMNTASGRCKEIDSGSESALSEISIKDEPLSSPGSPESCPMSPDSSDSYVIHHKRKASQKIYGQSVLKKPKLLLSPGVYSGHDRTHMAKLSIKVESGSGSGFSLPPTPPSSTSSDSESIPSEAADVRRNSRLYLASSSRQPIHTPLISNQPKGSTGILMLTEEEKRTLMAEGYPVPTRLPLTKQEEKSLKKIRRKIKNKISAQESRRKKKEYMDTLERKVETLESENSQYRKRLDLLEEDNTSLMAQLRKIQAELRRHDSTAFSHVMSRCGIK